jgi:hypothetical protein
MKNLHDSSNDRLTVEHMKNPLRELGPEIASLLRRASMGYLYEEQLVPLQASGMLMAALATHSLTWPSAGSRPQEAEAIALAANDEDKGALLSPVIVAPQHHLNLGLIAATFQALLDSLYAAGTQQVAILAREGSVVVQSTLASVGFAPSTTLAVTDFAQYVAFMAHPKEVLERLGIADLRQSDLLALRVEPKVLHQLLLFNLILDAAARPVFVGRPEWAEVLPGLAGWGRYRIDGGINTPSPDPRWRPDQVGIEIVGPISGS